MPEKKSQTGTAKRSQKVYVVFDPDNKDQPIIRVSRKLDNVVSELQQGKKFQQVEIT